MGGGTVGDLNHTTAEKAGILHCINSQTFQNVTVVQTTLSAVRRFFHHFVLSRVENKDIEMVFNISSYLEGEKNVLIFSTLVENISYFSIRRVRQEMQQLMAKLEVNILANQDKI